MTSQTHKVEVSDSTGPRPNRPPEEGDSNITKPNLPEQRANGALRNGGRWLHGRWHNHRDYVNRVQEGYCWPITCPDRICWVKQLSFMDRNGCQTIWQAWKMSSKNCTCFCHFSTLTCLFGFPLWRMRHKCLVFVLNRSRPSFHVKWLVRSIASPILAMSWSFYLHVALTVLGMPEIILDNDCAIACNVSYAGIRAPWVS